MLIEWIEGVGRIEWIEGVKWIVRNQRIERIELKIVIHLRSATVLIWSIRASPLHPFFAAAGATFTQSAQSVVSTQTPQSNESSLKPRRKKILSLCLTNRRLGAALIYQISSFAGSEYFTNFNSIRPIHSILRIKPLNSVHPLNPPKFRGIVD